MGLFNRKNDDNITVMNAVNVNSVDTSAIAKPFLFSLNGKGRKDFASLFLYMIIERIFNALRNIRWYSTEISFTSDDIARFIDENAQLLVHHYWKDGYACVICDKIGIRMPYLNELRKDSQGRIINKNAVVIYSDPYVIERKTHYMFAMPLLDAINNNLNNCDFVTANLGLFGILSGKGIPISPAAKADLQDVLKKKYGYGDDKFQFIMSNTELSYQPITIPVDQLKLNENVDFEIKQLCRFFQINPDLIFGNSTFANSEEAARTFYRDCIMPLAEMLLQLGRSAYIFMNDSDKPSTILTYDLSNIPELNTSLSAASEERKKYLDLLLAMRDAGVDVTEELTKLYADVKDLLKKV